MFGFEDTFRLEDTFYLAAGHWTGNKQRDIKGQHYVWQLIERRIQHFHHWVEVSYVYWNWGRHDYKLSWTNWNITTIWRYTVPIVSSVQYIVHKNFVNGVNVFYDLCVYFVLLCIILRRVVPNGRPSSCWSVTCGSSQGVLCSSA